MAFTVTWRARNTIGDRVEDYGKIITDGTEGNAKMRMSWVDEIDVIAPVDSGSDRYCTFYLNTDDTTEDGSVPGNVHFEAIKSGGTYYFRAVGRG